MNNGEFGNCGYMHGISCISIVESPERYIKKSEDDDDKKSILMVEEKVMVAALEKMEEKAVKTCSSSSSKSSSIGKNSDISGNSMDNSNDADEVQSSHKNPLDSMQALEDVLPMRRGISRLYNGRSKSFATLPVSGSITILGKPDNKYTRRRRNLLANSLAWDKNRNFQLSCNGGGISKKVKVTNSSKATLALAVAMSRSKEDCSDNLSNGCKLVSRSQPQHSHFHPRYAELDSGGPGGDGARWSAASTGSDR